MSRWPLTVRGTGAVLLAVACFAAAHAFRITELLYIAVLLLIAVGGGLATLYLARGTEKVVRAFAPDVATVGREVAVRLRVDIRSPLPAAQGRWRDTLPPGIVGDAEGVFPQTGSAMWSGLRTADLGYAVTAQRRGIHNVGPVAVTSTDPFGFTRRRHTIGAATALTVTPAVIELAPLAEQPGEAGGSMHTTTDQLGQGADNLVPRHYVPGDSMRRIHWRASAHRDQLMVRQEEQETTPEAIVVLDCAGSRWDAAASRSPGGDPRFELAVSACVSAVARLVAEGYIVEVLGADGTRLADPIDGGDLGGVEQFAIELATLTAHRDARAGAAALVALFAGTTTGPLVYITGAIGTADATALAPLPHHSVLPMLLGVAPRAGERAGALADAAATGWRIAEIADEADLPDAWRALVERGARRVGV